MNHKCDILSARNVLAIICVHVFYNYYTYTCICSIKCIVYSTMYIILLFKQKFWYGYNHSTIYAYTYVCVHNNCSTCTYVYHYIHAIIIHVVIRTHSILLSSLIPPPPSLLCLFCTLQSPYFSHAHLNLNHSLSLPPSLLHPFLPSSLPPFLPPSPTYLFPPPPPFLCSVLCARWHSTWQTF